MKRQMLQPLLDLAAICAAKQVRHAVLAPGSRNAPLLMALAGEPSIHHHSSVDERSGAYLAMGLAQQTQDIALFVCTSGTAVMNAASAVAESFYQHIPLVVISADRPAEWIDQQEGQSIHQNGLFEPHVKKSYTFPIDDGHTESDWHAARIVNDALNTARAFPRGPVHINIPLREPLYFPKAIRPVSTLPVKTIEMVEGVPLLEKQQTTQLSHELASFKRIWVVAGQMTKETTLLRAIERFQARYPVPITYDVTGNLHPLTEPFTMPDYAAGTLTAKETPDLLITFGHSLLSKRLKNFFRDHPPQEHWHLGLGGAIDTFRVLSRHIHMSPALFLEQLAKTPIRTTVQEDYAQTLRERAAKAKTQFTRALHKQKGLTEFKTMEALLRFLPSKGVLHLGNSLSVRLADYCGTIQKGIEVFSNRGTSGIDGSLSTAVGHALASPEKKHICILGDLSFFYDSNALWMPSPPNNLQIVVINNFHGGIFSIIKGSRNHPALIPLQTTPHARTARSLAEEFGLSYRSVETERDLPLVVKPFFAEQDGRRLLEILIHNPIDPSLLHS